MTTVLEKNVEIKCTWRNLHRWQKFYTAAGSDGIDKFHLRCLILSPSSPSGNLTSPDQVTLGLLTELKGDDLELEIVIILPWHSRLNWT